MTRSDKNTLPPPRGRLDILFNNAGILGGGKSIADEEVAALVAFLASDEASFITAAEYLVDGGSLAPHPGI